MEALLLILLVPGFLLAVGWLLLAGATSYRAANGVLLMVAAAGIAVWLASETTLDAGW